MKQQSQKALRQAKAKRRKEGKFYRLCFSNRYVLLSFACSVLISLIVAYSYSMWPFGDISILRMDLYHQYGPLFGELYDRLTSLDFSSYSWESGGGGLWLGNFFNYLSSPLSFLVLLFGHAKVPQFVGFLIFLKASLAAAAFTYYLKASEQFKMHNPVSAGLGLLYAWSAWFVAYYWNVMWLDGMILLPLIILGLEKLVNGKTPWLYVVTLTLLVLSSYYMCYIIALFCMIYFVMYYLSNHELDRQFVRQAFRCFLYALLAVGLSAFAILPLYFTLKGTYATSGTFPTTASTYFNFFDYIVNHFSSLEPTIRSSGDNVLPNVYCGVLSILTLVLYFYVPSIPLRKKVARMVVVAFYYFSFNLNMLNYIWHGFHYPNDLPYRQSFTYIFLLLIIAADTIRHIHEIKGRDILTVSLLAGAFLVLAEKLGSANISSSTILLSLVFVIVYAIVLALFHNPKFKESAVAALLFVALFAEVTVSDVTHFEIDQPVSNYAGQYEEMQQCLEYTEKQDSSGAYRTEITGPTRIMEPCWYGYRGISCFSSMASEKVSNLQYNLGLRSNYVNSYTYHLQTPVYNMMFGIKYIINNDVSNTTMNTDYLDQIGHTANMEIWKNRYTLPLAYAVDQSAEEWNYYSTNAFTVQSDYFERATGVSDVFTNVPVDSVTYDNVIAFTQDLSSGNYVYHKANTREDATFTANIPVTDSHNYYVYVSSRGLDTVTISNEDESVSQSVDPSEPYIVDMGVLNKGDTIHVECPCSEDSSTVEIYVVYVNEENLQKGYEVLNDDGAMQIETWEDTYVKGTVTIGQNEDLFTSINYDAGWSVYVDGKKVSADKLFKYGDALIGVKMDPGSHTVEFKFHAQGYRLGLLISGLTLLGILLFSLVLPFLRKKTGKDLRFPKRKKSGAKGSSKKAKIKKGASRNQAPVPMSKTRAAALQEQEVRQQYAAQHQMTQQPQAQQRYFQDIPVAKSPDKTTPKE